MRLIPLLLLAFLVSCPVLAKNPRELTGEEWVQMVQDEKTDFVRAVIQSYEAQGVAVRRPVSFYIYLLDTTIPSSAEYESRGVDELLGEFLRRNEPGVQAALHSTKQ